MLHEFPFRCELIGASRLHPFIRSISEPPPDGCDNSATLSYLGRSGREMNAKVAGEVFGAAATVRRRISASPDLKIRTEPARPSRLRTQSPCCRPPEPSPHGNAGPWRL